MTIELITPTCVTGVVNPERRPRMLRSLENAPGRARLTEDRRRAGSPASSEVLRKLPLFSALDESTLLAVQRVTQHRSYARNEYIVRAGVAPTGLFILLDGRARVLMESELGRHLTLGTLHPNELFGELGLIDAQTTFAAVVAVDVCEVLYVPAQPLKASLEHNVDAAMSLLRMAVKQLHTAHRKLANIGLMDVYGRVASVLVETSRSIAGERVVEPGSEEIASMVGASREMVSRVISDMAKRGLVRRHRRKVVIVKCDAVARLERKARA